MNQIHRPSPQLTLASPAKLNLFLHVLSRRDDGYHELETLFQLIDLADLLTFTLRQDAQITLDCPAVPGALTDNLIYRAAKLLQQEKLHQLEQARQPTKSSGVHISVIKKIPQGGGLGGGSSNAATTLLALNHLWSLGLSKSTLCEMGGKLGADVPIFIEGHSAWAKGTGDNFIKAHQPPLWFVLVKPSNGITTADVFQHPELRRNTPACIDSLHAQANQNQAPTCIAPSNELWRMTHNDCQPIACELEPDIKRILAWLTLRAPARMTGTGSTCFTIHETKASAEALYDAIAIAAEREELPADWWHLAQGLAHSPTLPLESTPYNVR